MYLVTYKHQKGNPKISEQNTVRKALSGKVLSDDEAMSLASVNSDAIPDLCAAASQIRDLGKGNIITFSPKVFIPLTRLCRDYCGYCTFRVEPENTDQMYMSPDEVLTVAKAGQRLGCTEALFTLGERPEQKYPAAKNWLGKRGYTTTLQYLVEMCKLVTEETTLLPHANPGTMSKREIASLKPHNPSMGLMLESTSTKLYATGGPHEFAPSKRPRVRLRTIEIAGELHVPFTTGLLIGIGESLSDRIESLLSIRKLHSTHGHIQEVIIQNFRAKPHTPMENSPHASAQDLLWTLAVARLILGPNVNIQIPPNLNAIDYDTYLGAGINDWGGVSPLTIDYVNPEAPWPALVDLQNKTNAQGFELRPRLAVYPEYFINTDRYLPAEIKGRVSALADDDGYVKGGIQRYAGTD